MPFYQTIPILIGNFTAQRESENGNGNFAIIIAIAQNKQRAGGRNEIARSATVGKNGHRV